MIAEALPAIMFVSLLVLLFSGYPVAFGLGGVALVFGLIGMTLGVFAFGEFNNLIFRIWGGIASNLLLVAVPMFILMGITLERSGIAEDLLASMSRILARVPGGLAMAVTGMGTILAASTGIIGASVIMMGVIALPSMLRRGYDPRLAAGTICASGTLGILIPPSIMLVLIGDLLQISVGDLFMAAVFPGLVLSGLYLVYILTICSVRPALAPPSSQRDDDMALAALLALLARSLLPPVSLIAVVLGSIFFGLATPTEAAGVGAAGAMVLALVRRRLSRPVLREIVDRSAGTTAIVFAILIGATAFSYVFRSLGGEAQIEALFGWLALGPWGELGVMLALIFVLGFFFEWLEIILIILPLFGPIVATLDFGDHLAPKHVATWFAMLVAVNLQTSFLTPPFGFALFYLKGVAPPQIQLMHLYRGIVPFVLLQLVGLGLVVLFPALTTWLPEKALG